LVGGLAHTMETAFGKKGGWQTWGHQGRKQIVSLWWKKKNGRGHLPQRGGRGRMGLGIYEGGGEKKQKPPEGHTLQTKRTNQAPWSKYCNKKQPDELGQGKCATNKKWGRHEKQRKNEEEEKKCLYGEGSKRLSKKPKASVKTTAPSRKVQGGDRKTAATNWITKTKNRSPNVGVVKTAKGKEGKKI